MSNLLIAGNWKMNKGPEEAQKLLKEIRANLDGRKLTSQVAVFPPYVSIHTAKEVLDETPVFIGAQNVHESSPGAFTGEVSSSMLLEAGCSHVIIGHSERREHFGESNELVARKARRAINDGLKVILCVGETLQERKKNRHQKVVMEQLRSVLQQLTEENANSLTIAYEPVWAIGTGETATPQQAQEMHAFIRNYLTELWSTQALSGLKILYGGSMKPENAMELLKQEDVDGGLIGGASLKAESFCEIINIAENLSR